MRRRRLPESWRGLLQGVTFIGAVPLAFGVGGAWSLLGVSSPPGWIPGLLKLAGLGGVLLSLRFLFVLAERRGLLVFVSPPDEAELLRDRHLALAAPGAQPLRDVAPVLSKEPPRPLRGVSLALFAGGVGVWVLGAGMLLARDVVLEWTGPAGLLLILAGLAAAFFGELARGWRVLRADAED